MWLGVFIIQKYNQLNFKAVWKNKFEKLISQVEGKISESSADNNDPTLKY